jgi:hypothetical protein
VTKWTKAGARRAVMVGVIAIVGVIALGAAFIAIRGDRTATQYELEMPSAPFGGGWACFACGAPEGISFSGPAAGVAAGLPTDPVFRGVVVTSEAFPDDLRNVRILPDGYYLEFADGTVRFVADEAPWIALVPELRTAAEPEWISYLVREGVIDPA